MSAANPPMRLVDYAALIHATYFTLFWNRCYGASRSTRHPFPLRS